MSTTQATSIESNTESILIDHSATTTIKQRSKLSSLCPSIEPNDDQLSYKEHLDNELVALRVFFRSFFKFTRTYRCLKRKLKLLINLKTIYFQTIKSPFSYLLFIPITIFFVWLMLRLFAYNELYAAIRAQNLKYSIMCENATSSGGFYTPQTEPISSYNYHKYFLEKHNAYLEHYSSSENKTECSCKLLGHCYSRMPPDTLEIYSRTIEFSEFIKLYMYPVQLGGYWKPAKCQPDFDSNLNHDVDKLTLIVIPYLNRYENLKELLYNLHPFLQRQFINYRLVVVEQANSEQSFNKGRLYNTAFSFMKNVYSTKASELLLSKSLDYEKIKREILSVHGGRRVEFSCLILHDVDLIPENDYNIYECDEHTPRHLSLSIRRNDNLGYYKNLYELLIGGVLTMKPVMYESVNGFSNEYWKWGAEDDDLAFRMLAKDMCIQRPAEQVSVYKMSSHKPSQRNPIRTRLLFSTVERMPIDGLSDLQQLGIDIVDVQLYSLFTHIKVDVKRPSDDYNQKYS